VLIRQGKFERNRPSKLKVFGSVHHAHSSSGEIVTHAEMRHGLTDYAKWIARSGSRLWSVARRTKQVLAHCGFRPRIGPQEPLDCIAENRILRAYCLEARTACGTIELDQLVKERARSLPQSAIEAH
jgi:hypothetical protein